MDKKYYPKPFVVDKFANSQWYVLAKVKRDIEHYRRVKRDWRDSVIMSDMYFNQNKVGGISMKISFLRTENIMTKKNAQGKSYPMVKVVGIALQGKMEGAEWDTKFFPSKKHMLDVVKAAKEGDIMEIKMVPNGDFLNPEAITILDGEEAAVQQAVVKSTPQVSDRVRNLEVAVAIMGPKGLDQDPIEYLTNAAEVADIVDDYVKEKGAFQFSKAEDDIPEADDDSNEDEIEETPF